MGYNSFTSNQGTQTAIYTDNTGGTGSGGTVIAVQKVDISGQGTAGTLWNGGVTGTINNGSIAVTAGTIGTLGAIGTLPNLPGGTFNSGTITAGTINNIGSVVGLGGTVNNSPTIYTLSGTTLMQSASATGLGTAVTTTGYGAALLAVSGTWVGTITLVGTSQLGQTSGVLGVQIGVGAIGTTITSNGLYQVDSYGLSGVYGSVSAYTSGTITIVGEAIPIPYTHNVLNANLPQKIAGEDLTNDVVKVEQRFSYSYISTAATTTVKSGSGFLHTITVEGGTGGAITIFDNTAGSGTNIGVFDSTSNLTTYTFDVSFSTGLTIVTAQATKLTVSYR